MKFSVPNRAPKVVLEKVDEIKIAYNDRAIAYELFEQYPHANFVFCQPKTEHVDVNELNSFYEKADRKLTIEFEDIRDKKNYKVNEEIPFYWHYPATTFEELNALSKIGVSQVLIDSPLFFSLDRVKNFKIPCRVIPNICHDGYLPSKSSIHSKWIRPQDISLYESYIDTLELVADKPSKYKTLYKIYAEDKTWNEDMCFLFSNFTQSVIAGAFPQQTIERRLNCGQICTEGKCSLCDTSVILSRNLSKRIIDEFKDSL